MRPRHVLLAAAPLGIAVFAVVRWVDVGGAPQGEAEAEVEVWEFMIAASVVLWTALAAVGLGRLEKPPPRGSVGGFLAAVYGAIALLLAFTGLAGIENDFVVAGQQWKNVLLHVIAAVAILPWPLALKRIQLRAADDREWSATASDLERIRNSRSGLQAATAALGGMVAAAVILTGALREAVTAAHLDTSPDSYVLLYGAWLTAVLAAIYLHVFGAIERRSRWMLDRTAPLPDPAVESADDFAKAFELRAQLAQELDLGGDPRANLEGLVAVLAPLAGALLARFGGL